MIQQTVSPTLIDRSSGHLSRAMTRQAASTYIPLWSNKLKHIHLAIEVMASHKSADACLNELHHPF